MWVRALKTKIKPTPDYLKFKNEYVKFNRNLLRLTHIWSIGIAVIVLYGIHLFYIKNDSHHSPENALLAYYDAIDFKRFEKAHSLINPKSNLSIAQYMLEISVTDGLLSSYAKLDAIETKITTQNDTLAAAIVSTKWITPLEKIKRTDYRTLAKVKGKWYVNPEDIDLDLPPDQFYSNNETDYFNQGRRRITTEQTHHEDVLKQPVLEIISAKLVKHKKSYALIGEVQNVDNVPADVVLKATLYNDANKTLATYNAKHQIKHKLMPKEISAFRINFEGIAWSKTKDSIPKTFNPDEFTPVAFEEQPTKFNLQAAGNVSGSDLYKQTVLSDLEISDSIISGKLFNSGLKEVTIPQIIISYFDADKNLLWVDHDFVIEGIRQQRQQHFEYVIETDSVKVISTDMENCFVNGLPNKDIADKVIPNRIKNQTYTELQAINHPIYNFVKLETNAYLGNPD